MSSQQTGSALQTTVATGKITITKPPLGSPIKRTYTFRVKRYDPEKRRYYWREYKVELTNHETVLDGLLKIKWSQDATLSFRYSCRMGICGSCGMIINGTPRLACETKPYDLGTEVVTIEPLSNFEPIKDVATDFSDFFRKHRSVKPWLIRKDETEQFEKLETYYPQTEEQLSDYLEFAYCIKCGLCYSACPMVFLNKDYLAHRPSPRHIGGVPIVGMRAPCLGLRSLIARTASGHATTAAPAVRYAPPRMLIQPWQ